MRLAYLIKVLVALLAFSGSALSQWQWSQNVTRVGGLPLGRDVVDLTISGDYAYCADEYGLSVWDLTEPEMPMEVARTRTPGLSKAIVITGDYAYVGDFFRGLAVFNISAPRRPQMIGFLELNEFFYSGATPKFKIIIRDNILFLFSGFGLWIISLDDPAYPEIISRWVPPRPALTDIVLNGDIAYLSSRLNFGLFVLNIENPETPELILSMDVPEIDAIALRDTLLYSIGAGANLHFSIYNIINPEEPELLRAYREIEANTYLVLDDNYVYTLVPSRSPCVVIDVSNPEQAEIVARSNVAMASKAVKSGDYWFCASGSVGIKVISVDDPEHPALVNAESLFPKYQLKVLDVDDGIAYLQAVDHSFLIVDVRNVRNPSMISEYVRPFRNPFLVKYQHYVYYGAGGIILDIENPDHPDSVGDFGFWSGWPGRSADMYVLDEYAYVPGKHSYQFVDYNLLVLDLSDPTHPDSVGIRRDCQMPLAISSLDGTLLYQISILNDWNDATPHVFVYSLEEPGRPEYLGRWPVGPENRYGLYMKILVHNSYAYVWCDAVHELWIYSVEDPVDPRFIRSLELGISSISDMSIDDDIIYLGGSVAGFGCMSITDPENPEIVGYYDTPGGVCELKGINGYVYVTDYYELGIYDCAELHGIWNLQASEDSHNFGYSPPDSTAVWELMLTNAAEQAVQVLSVTVDSAVFNVEFNDTLTLESDEETSILVTFTPTEPRDYNGRLTVHTERRDLVVTLSGTGVPLSVPEEPNVPREFALHPVYPNPFNSVAQIRYDLPKTTKVALTVYDVTGRKVIRLVDGQRTVGYHNVPWRGVSTNGTPVTSGVYFVRLEAGSFVKVNKLTLIR